MLKYQEILANYKKLKIDNKSTISLDLLYNTSDNNYNLQGLILNIHYEFSKLEPLSIKDNCPSMFSSNNLSDIIDDPDDKNYKIIRIIWGDLFIKWPGKKVRETFIKFFTDQVSHEPILPLRSLH